VNQPHVVIPERQALWTWSACLAFSCWCRGATAGMGRVERSVGAAPWNDV